MMAKISLLLVFITFISMGVARLSDHHQSSGSKEHHHKGDKHSHGKEHEHEKRNEHQHHHNHGGGGGDESPYGGSMDVKINPDSPYMKVKNLTEDLYTEIFVIASGDNYASQEVSDDVHISARALVLLSQSLEKMLVIYPMFFKLTTEYAIKGARMEDKQTMPNLIQDLVAQIKERRWISSYETLKNNLTHSTFISRGKYFKSGATPLEKAEAYDKWLCDPFVKATTMNRLVYRSLWENDEPPYYKLLRAMVWESIDIKNGEKTKKLYALLVAETIKKVCPAHDPRKAVSVFFQNLVDHRSEDPALMISIYDYEGTIPLPGVMAGVMADALQATLHVLMSTFIDILSG